MNAMVYVIALYCPGKVLLFYWYSNVKD